MLHRLLSCAALALVLSLTGCGDGNVTPSSGALPTFVPAAQSATIGVAGGAVNLSAADGTAFKFEVPPGALTTTTTLTLSTQKPTAGQRLNLLLQPAGLVLTSGATGTLTIALPGGQTLPASGGLAYDGVLIPFTRLPDGRLQVQLTALATATVAAPAGLRSLAAALRLAPAATAAVCGSAPDLQTAGGLTALDAVDVELYGQCMVAAVQDLAVNEQFVQAVRLAQSVAAYLQATGAGNPNQFLDQASSLACLAYRQALDRAIGTSVSDMGSLYAQARPIMFWESIIQSMGTTCPGVPLTEYQTVLHTKAGEALDYYAQQKPGITDTNSAAYASAKAEAVESQRTRNEVLALNPAPALAATLNTEVTQRAQPAIVDALLQAPWLRCRDTGNYDELMALMDALGSPDSVKDAAHYCGTQMSIEVLDSQSQSTGNLNGLGGVAAGQNQPTGSVRVAVDGQLRISGPIAGVRCPAGAPNNEALVLRLNGVEVQRVSPAPYLANPLTLSISALRALQVWQQPT